ncbi:MAG TPA: hypothetical protein VKE70_02675 [Candidatus Solibacter sp.]|nr:hypothetical protein [Candidatus Solibacter sp.]
MAALSDVEKLLPLLSPGEKAQILKSLVQQMGDAFPALIPARTSAEVSLALSGRGFRSGCWSRVDASV